MPFRDEEKIRNSVFHTFWQKNNIQLD
jgi:hypothetical protein